ncbi:ABC transporter permease [Amycolatopsis azurea]|uniref:Dipeptide transport system permease protein DppC n=1 Tax=Amycolatopsis azurea DSM 43854 TaxID=1238180 RepID=M2PXB4_9PSEU|nr:ABC transporter permease [Amycolatopsis azurea]EMD29273.1 Dipeptide transport system permease protein DppC [Amycolatopsis azurea DSM 43854]OOC01893.1 peptide ABC transporter permease [Amycolatopsis azurea DSM 43854]
MAIAETTLARPRTFLVPWRPGLVLSAAWLLLVVVAAVTPSVFAPGDPLAIDTAARLLPPSLDHPFGTDRLGRDLFAQTVHGAGRTLPAAVLATLIGLGAGVTLGLLSGFLRGVVDLALMRLVDVLLAIPGLLLALMLVSVLGKGSTIDVAIAIGVTAIAGTARVMRAEVLRIAGSDFVEAARIGGARRSRIVLRHVLPNAMGPVWVLTLLLFGMAILGVTTLSFLGFGTQPPTPEWGALVSSGRDFLGSAWWLSLLPGAVVALTVLAANRVSLVFDKGGSEPW